MPPPIHCNRRRRSPARVGAGLMAALLAIVGCTESRVDPEDQFVQEQCGTCHAVPRASSFPTSEWPRVIQWMNTVVERTGGVPFEASVLTRVTDYYTARSPQTLPKNPADPPRQTLGLTPRALAQTPELSVTNINVVDLNDDGRLDLLVCESSGLGGKVGRVTLYEQRREEEEGDLWVPTTLALLPHPAHSEVLDFDGDGDLDIVVAVLGIFGPSESPRGEVTLLVNEGDLRFRRRPLLEDVTRVADVRPADLNGDGLVDFVFAEFGHRKTGSVGWLEQRPSGDFVRHPLLGLPGSIHVPVADLKGDGALDIVALFSQYTQEIVAFLGDGRGGFEARSLYKAPMVEFGASSMELVDLDGDLDLDILLTNGDSADTGAKTRTKFRMLHGVQWLENRGGLRFEPHFLMRFYGAYSSTAGDLDGDGDLDIVAGSFLTDLGDPNRHSLVWLENDGHQQFEPHSLARIPRSLVTLQVVDLDQDGLPEIIAGGLLMPGYSRIQAEFDTRAPLSLWSRRQP